MSLGPHLVPKLFGAFNAIFSARCNNYISRAYATMSVSVCLSVSLWRKCIVVTVHARGEGSSRAMLATARPSCFSLWCIVVSCSDFPKFTFLRPTKSIFQYYFAPCTKDNNIEASFTSNWTGHHPDRVGKCIGLPLVLRFFPKWKTKKNTYFPFSAKNKGD